MINKIINNIDCKILKNEPMKDHTTFGIGGPVTLYIFPIFTLCSYSISIMQTSTE